MTELIKGVLGGGWSLVVGWILPSMLNVILFVYVVYPVLPQQETANSKAVLAGEPLQTGAILLFLALVTGLLLAAVQTPLYRLLEGYVGWHPTGMGWRHRLMNPWAAVLTWSHRRQLRRKQIILGRLDLAELEALAAAGSLRDDLQIRLEEVRADRRLDRYVAGDRERGAAQLGLLREQVRRYPVSDQQVVPTRLGNAIRRLEEYGYERFRLDSQLLWYELSAVAPAQAVKDAERSRVTVDFMVCLLSGHILIALTAVGAIMLGANGWEILVFVAVALCLLARLWYHVAVSSTDDWAAAVRSLVNLSRKPLITSLGLRVPVTLAKERELWAAISRLSARPFDARSAMLDRHRLPAEPSRRSASR